MKQTFQKPSKFGPRSIELELDNEDVSQFKLSQFVDKGRLNDPNAASYDVYCDACNGKRGHVTIAPVSDDR